MNIVKSPVWKMTTGQSPELLEKEDSEKIWLFDLVLLQIRSAAH